MNESKMDNLLKRLQRLEQDNRSLKILGSLVVIVLSMVLLMGATQSKQSEIIDVIRARQFTLVDKDGTARAGMGILPDGTVVIGLIDKNGTLRTGLRLSANGATGLSVHTGEGKAASLIAEPDNGKVHLDLTDKNLNVRASLAIEADGSPSLILRDENGNVTLSLP